MKFSCYATNSSTSVVERKTIYSYNSAANTVCPKNSAIYKLSPVNSSAFGDMTNVLQCTIPSSVTGYTNVVITGIQLLGYSSASANLNWANDLWDTASTTYGSFSGTTGSAYANNQIRMTANASVGTRPLGAAYSTAGTFDLDSASYDYWCSYFSTTFAATCATTKTAAVGAGAAAATIYQNGWASGLWGKTGWNKLTLKANFTSVTASSTSTDYGAQAASLYNYILAKYGTIEAGTSQYLSNYAGRTITPFSGANTASLVSNAQDDNGSSLLLGGLAGAAVLAAGAYFFVRKKKSA
jgi:LPXTG-motif cell wall-anchored protein